MIRLVCTALVLLLTGCVVTTVVGTAVDVTTTAVGTAVDVGAGAVDLVVPDSDEDD